MDDSQQSPSVSCLCLINFHLSIVYSIRFLDRIDDPLFDRTDEDLTIRISCSVMSMVEASDAESVERLQISCHGSVTLQ